MGTKIVKKKMKMGTKICQFPIFGRLDLLIIWFGRTTTSRHPTQNISKGLLL